MKIRALLFAISTIAVFSSCRKNDPANSPEYIGRWRSHDTSSSLLSNHSNITLVINADGTGYDTWSDGASGKCQIKNGYIKIGKVHKHTILEAPHSVPLFTFEDSLYDTIQSSTKMRIHLGDDSFYQIFRTDVDFYKVE